MPDSPKEKLEIKANRFIGTDKSTISEVTMDMEAFACYFLEDTVREAGKKVYGKTAISAGKYPITLTYSPKYDQDMLLINDVPDFEGVRLHPGNEPKDTDGCPLPGYSYSKDWVSDSGAAYGDLFAIVVPYLQRGAEVYITFENNFQKGDGNMAKSKKDKASSAPTVEESKVSSSYSSTIYKLQCAILENGVDVVPDGLLGPRTKAAVKELSKVLA